MEGMPSRTNATGVAGEQDRGGGAPAHLLVAPLERLESIKGIIGNRSNGSGQADARASPLCGVLKGPTHLNIPVDPWDDRLPRSR